MIKYILIFICGFLLGAYMMDKLIIHYLSNVEANIKKINEEMLSKITED